MKLMICIVYFICTGSAVTGQDTSTPLATTTCCYTKSVGGVAYTLVKGNTVEGNGCLEDCVYERDDSPGPQYCFAKGNLMVKCSNSETEFQGVNVTSSKRAADNYTDWMAFNTTIGFINCTVDAVLPFNAASKNIECSHTGLTPGELDSSTKRSTAGQEPAGDTNVPFIYSMLEGLIQRFSIFSEDCFINCPWGWSCTILPPTDYNTIYVEDAFPVVDMAACKELCDTQTNMGVKNCTFWTWSDLEEKNWAIDDGREKRNHDDISECGLRNYTANELIPTAQGQFCAQRNSNDVKNGQVFVGKFYYLRTEYDCLIFCKLDKDCNSWTFQYPPLFNIFHSPPLCVLNYGFTERKIKVCKYVTCGPFRGVIVSGC